MANFFKKLKNKIKTNKYAKVYYHKVVLIRMYMTFFWVKSGTILIFVKKYYK